MAADFYGITQKFIIDFSLFKISVTKLSPFHTMKVRTNRERNGDMRIDKEQLKSLSEKPDDELWQIINSIASRHGYELPKVTPKSEDMEKIRAAMRGTEKLNMKEAVRLMSAYKKRGE